jgi:hypothetical protein
VLLLQVTGETRSGRGHASNQGDVLILALLIDQLKARFPVACRLAAPQRVYLSLGGQTR